MQQIHIKLALHKLCYLLVIVGILCLFIPGNSIAFAESIPGGNVSDTTIRAVDIAQPAVVRIITNENAQLAVHFATPNTDVTFPQTPSGTYQINLSGTGTFITSQGDILTADHVVSPPTSDLNGALYGLAAQDVADYMNKGASTQVTKDQVLQQLTSGQLKNTPAYQKPSSSVFLSTAYTSQTDAINFNSLPTGIGVNVDKIKMESSPDKQDTAIIHVPLTDTLSVPLANSSDVNPQDQLTIVGFPGNADVSQKPDSLLTPSLNQIYVSSLKTSNSGAPLIQVGGNVEHGDSGGPALDNQGNIVGVVSFGTSSSGGGLNGTSFLQASSSAQSMIKSLKLNTAPGDQQKLWEQAFTDYAATSAGHWAKAQQEFAQLSKNYPLFKGTQQFQNYAQTQTGTQVSSASTPAGSTASPPGKAQPKPSTTNTPVTWQATALTIGAVAIMIILAVLLVGAALRQKTKAKKVILKRGSSVHNQANDSRSAVARPSSQTPPTSTTVPSANPKSAQPASAGNQNTLSLKVWPCGHMNRSTARFCSVCGELAPTSTTDA
jgi:serine protease Do